ncbi:MAG: DUF5674 family protein [Candidatus Paceibacterota bacterium]|jgi:hypothetical protein
MIIKIIKNSISKKELQEIAQSGFGYMVKGVVDIKQEILALGGELHADEEVLLFEEEKSSRENTWGINLYPEKTGEEFIEYDSMINIKPGFGNLSRSVENPEIREKINNIVKKLINDQPISA